MTARLHITPNSVQGDAADVTAFLGALVDATLPGSLLADTSGFVDSARAILLAPRGRLLLTVSAPQWVIRHRIVLSGSGALRHSSSTDDPVADAALFPVGVLPGVVARLAHLSPGLALPEGATSCMVPDALVARIDELADDDPTPRHRAFGEIAEELGGDEDVSGWRAIRVIRDGRGESGVATLLQGSAGMVAITSGPAGRTAHPVRALGAFRVLMSAAA